MRLGEAEGRDWGSSVKGVALTGRKAAKAPEQKVLEPSGPFSVLIFRSAARLS